MKKNFYTLAFLLASVVLFSSCVRDGVYRESNYEMLQGRWQFNSVAERTYDDYNGYLLNTYYYPVGYNDYLEFRRNGTVYSSTTTNQELANYYLTNNDTRLQINGKTYRIVDISYSYLTLLLTEYDWAGGSRIRVETNFSLRRY